jgi:hypothetical protein
MRVEASRINIQNSGKVQIPKIKDFSIVGG